MGTGESRLLLNLPTFSFEWGITDSKEMLHQEEGVDWENNYMAWTIPSAREPESNFAESACMLSPTHQHLQQKTEHLQKLNQQD